MCKQKACVCNTCREHMGSCQVTEHLQHNSFLTAAVLELSSLHKWESWRLLQVRVRL